MIDPSLTADTIYTTFGLRVSQTLLYVSDPEFTNWDIVVRESANYRLGFWAYYVGPRVYSLESDVIREDNASIGSSEITVTFVDTVTRAEFNMTYPLTILDVGTYYRYVALGVITEQESTVLLSGSPSGASVPGPSSGSFGPFGPGGSAAPGGPAGPGGIGGGPGG